VKLLLYSFAAEDLASGIGTKPEKKTKKTFKRLELNTQINFNRAQIYLA
jgi:hypothetical protein